MIDYEPKRWLSVIFRVRGTVLPRILTRVVLTGALGAIAYWAHNEYRTTIPSTAHALVGVALGLLLVFRTNASYDRFWEGRKLFGAYVNRSRDVARQIAAYLDGDDEASRAQRATMTRLLVASYGLVRQHVRSERDLGALKDLVTDEERRQLEPVAVRPLLVLEWISARIAAAAREQRIPPGIVQAMDANVTVLLESTGGMERILKTPVPLAYAHHIKTFLTLFCFTVPFVMVDAMKAFTPVAAAIVAYGMFGIEEIGVEIEDPFGYDPNDLPLDRFGEVIERDVGVLLSARDGEAGRPRAAA